MTDKFKGIKNKELFKYKKEVEDVLKFNTKHLKIIQKELDDVNRTINSRTQNKNDHKTNK